LIINQRDCTNYILDSKKSFIPRHFNQFKILVNYQTDSIPEDAFYIDKMYGGNMTPLNFGELKRNSEFNYHLNTLLQNHNVVIHLNQLTMSRILSLIEDIKEEIKSLKN
jgi:hypothetical protein